MHRIKRKSKLKDTEKGITGEGRVWYNFLAMGVKMGRLKAWVEKKHSPQILQDEIKTLSEEAERSNHRRLLKLYLWAAVLLFLYSLLEAVLTNFSTLSRVDLVFTAAGLPMIGFFLVLSQRGAYAVWWKYFLGISTASLLTLTLVVYGFILGWEFARSSSTIAVYFLILALSTMYYSPSLSILTGTVIALEYTSMFLYSLGSAPEVEGAGIATFTTYMLAFGATTWVFALTANNLRQHLWQSLTRQLKLAEQQRSEDLQKQYFLNLSHEIKTPLAVMKISWETLRKKMPMDTQVRNMGAALEGLMKDVDDFLDHERLEKSSSGYIHVRGTDVSAVLQEMKVLYLPWFALQDQELRIQDTVEGYVQADPEAFRRVLRNLLDNALKYAGAGATIHVEVSVQEDSLTLVCRDDGPGIPDRVMDRLFEPYQRITSEGGVDSGVGMGLALVRLIMSEMGGGVSIRKDYSPGAAFELRFPRATGIMGQQGGPSGGKSSEPVFHPYPRERIYPHPASEFSILLVEDDPLLASVLVEALTQKFHLVLAQGGEEALKRVQIEKRHFDLVLSDVMMTSMGGFELRSQIFHRDLLPGVPWIFITAKSLPEDVAKGLDLGAVDYIIKPFSMETLKAKIEAHLTQTSVLLKNRFPSEYETMRVFRQEGGREAVFTARSAGYGLSEREVEVVHHLMAGLEYKEVGQFLGVSENTIKTYVRRIFSKTGARNRAELPSRFQ